MTLAPRSERIKLAFELGAAACVAPLVGWLFWAFALHLGPNDFHDYWLAGKLLLEGRSPYDAHAMAALAAREHLSFSLGGGYSYPLPFALAMVPLATLPFDTAAAIFGVVSLAAFGATVAGWLLVAAPDRVALAERRRLLSVAFAAGLYPPIYGSLAMGQANLLLLPLLAAGLWLAVRRTRSTAGGLFIGLTAIVKLVPGALVVPLALGRRWAAVAGLVLAAAVAMGLAALAAPSALAGSGGLASNLDADPFYSNQSINGFVSRLVLDAAKSRAILPGAFDPGIVMAALTSLLAIATLAVLWRGRGIAASNAAGLATAVAFTLTAATIGAPKTSFWNESFLLAGVALVLAFDAPDLRLSRLSAFDRRALALWLGSAVAWAVLWAIEPSPDGSLSAAINLAWSASLAGMLALWWMLARRLLGRPPLDGPNGGAPPQTADGSTIS